MAAARRHAPVLLRQCEMQMWTAASETVRDADVDVDIDLIRSMCKCNPFEVGQKAQSGQDKIGQTGQARKR